MHIHIYIYIYRERERVIHLFIVISITIIIIISFVIIKAAKYIWGVGYHWYGDVRFENWPDMNTIQTIVYYIILIMYYMCIHIYSILYYIIVNVLYYIKVDRFSEAWLWYRPDRCTVPWVDLQNNGRTTYAQSPY